jgi:hypothetical protein
MCTARAAERRIDLLRDAPFLFSEVIVRAALRELRLAKKLAPVHLLEFFE